MPPVESPPLTRRGPISRRVALSGWGQGPASSGWVVSPARRDELVAAVRDQSERPRPVDGQSPGPTGMIARGQGRSYGDAAQLREGLVLDMTALGGHELDPGTGEVTAGAGETIGRLQRALVPRGWMLPVVPGTQHVTVGGAIASDVHGKNHVQQGSFGRHVTAIGLINGDGEEIELRPGDADGRFEATVGGMGLTGVIVWATIALRPTNGTALSIDAERATDLDAILAALQAGDAEHRVAWLDLLGPRVARGIVTLARPRPDGAGRRPAASPARLRVPGFWPGGLLRPSIVRAFNARRFAMAARRESDRPGDYGAEMFPLDAVDSWPRLYGPAGLVQYQCVVPAGEEAVLQWVVERVRRSPTPCFLAVLKQLGPQSASPLSFPLAGWTLAMDMPRQAPGLFELVRALDELVGAAGGRVYLTKDALLSADTVSVMYPRLEQWRRVRDAMDPSGRWRSDLGTRTGLVAAA